MNIFLEPKYLQNLSGANCTVEKLDTNKVSHIDTDDMWAHKIYKNEELSTPEYLQNKYDETCTVKTFERKLVETIYCKVRLVEINDSFNVSPTLINMVKSLAKKFNLEKIPRIFMFNDSHCEWRKTGAAYFYYSFGSDEGIIISNSVLRRCSDGAIAGLIGHEDTHIKQRDLGIPFDEIEADIGSILATEGPCLAVDFFERYVEKDPSSLRVITGENAHEALKLENGYPLEESRVSLGLQMSAHYKERPKKLLSTDNEPPYLLYL